MSEMPAAPMFTCVTCEQSITARPTFHVGLPFCCAGCVANGPCTCSYDVDMPELEPASERAYHLVDAA